MNLRQYLFTFGFGTIVACLAWIMILLNIDPTSANLGIIIVFHLSLFIGTLGLFTTIGTLWRAWRYPKKSLEQAIRRSLRHGVMLSLLIQSCLILLSFELLSWWILLLLVLFVGAVEFFFLTKDHQHQR